MNFIPAPRRSPQPRSRKLVVSQTNTSSGGLAAKNVAAHNVRDADNDNGSVTNYGEYRDRQPSVKDGARDMHNEHPHKVSTNSESTSPLPTTSNEDDPPIAHYDSPDEHDRNDSKPSSSSQEEEDDDDEVSPRTRRIQLRKLMAASDDCWDTNLSDDEMQSGGGAMSSALPLEWEANMIRRQMMRRSNNNIIHNTSGSNNVGAAAVATAISGSGQGSNINATVNTAIHDNVANIIDPNAFGTSVDGTQTANSGDAELSLPEQLLQKRLRRKQRLQKKHDQYSRYQRQYSDDSSQYTDAGLPKMARKKHQPKQQSFGGISSSGILPRPASPLFPDEEFGQDYDDITSIVEEDNASMVASSNGDSKPEFRLCTPQKHQQSSPVAEESPLHSLPQRPICPFPEEADRKRIVGCLAAILASSYGYETVPHLMVKKMAVGKGVPISVNRLVPTEIDTFALEGHTARKDAEKGTKSSIDEKGCNSEGQQKEPKPPIPIQTNRPPSLSQSVPNHVNQRSVISPHSTSEIQTTKPPLPSRPKLSLQNSFSFSSFNNNKNPFDKSGSQTPPPNLSAELAEIRHRIRRHAILSDVLVSSADMLMLDPSHARAFLPMLEGLLSKVEDPTTNGMQNGGGNNATPVAGKRESWKGRGFGGGGMPDTNGYHSYHGASSTAATMYSTAMNSSASSICNSPSVPDLRMSEKVAIAKEEAKPPPSTATIQKCPEQMEIKKSPSSQKESPSDVDFYSPLDTVIVDKELVAPFLQTLTPGAGFRCIALLLLNHLLRDGRGYDARVRHAFKRLSVVILSHELKVGGILRVDLEDEDDLDVLLWGERERSKSDDLEDYDDAEELARLATRKFEAMEHAIAAKLISMSGQGSGTTPTTKASQKQSQPNRVSQRQLANDARSSSSSSSNVSHGRIALAPKDTPISAQHGLSKEQLLRGLKIGTGKL